MSGGGPIRVEILIDDLRLAGAQRHVAGLVAALDPARAAVGVTALMAGGPLAAEIERRGTPVAVLGLQRLYDPRVLPATLALAQRLRARGVEVVHTYLFCADMLGPVAARLAGARVIGTRREIGPDGGRRRHVLAYRVANRLVDRMVAVSHAARRAACAREGLAPERVAVIPNAVDPSRFEPRGRRAAMRAEIGAGPADVLVGAVGNLLPVKGHATLLDALATARAAAPGRALRLAIAGAGPLGPELRARAERLGIAGRTAFLGAVSDVPALLEALDIFALPSRSEGMSNALLEAAAAGLPVVASCAGGNPEVLRDGEEALFFPAGDAPALAEAILALARDPARARALGAAAKARVRRDFSPAALAARHHALYEEVAARSPAPLPPGGGGGRKEKAQHDPPANVRTTS